MTGRQLPSRVLKGAIVLAVVFDLLSLLVMIHTTPITFTLFMFIGQPLFVLVVLLLVGAVMADLRAKELF